MFRRLFCAAPTAQWLTAGMAECIFIRLCTRGAASRPQIWRAQGRGDTSCQARLTQHHDAMHDWYTPHANSKILLESPEPSHAPSFPFETSHRSPDLLGLRWCGSSNNAAPVRNIGRYVSQRHTANPMPDESALGSSPMAAHASAEHPHLPHAVWIPPSARCLASRSGNKLIYFPTPGQATPRCDRSTIDRGLAKSVQPHSRPVWRADTPNGEFPRVGARVFVQHLATSYAPSPKL
ncbi:hypothetical protein PSPO01_14426 [Paraphaeosphaeria sporulosa]